MGREIIFDEILCYFKQKGRLSDLEKDILSTLEKYMKDPFDRKDAEQKILENNQRYPDIVLTINALPGIQSRPFIDLSDEEVRNSLYLQIEAMWIKIHV